MATEYRSKKFLSTLKKSEIRRQLFLIVEFSISKEEAIFHDFFYRFEFSMSKCQFKKKKFRLFIMLVDPFFKARQEAMLMMKIKCYEIDSF